MKGITVRFGDSTYEAIRQEAVHEGIGMCAFIREAALARATVAQARRGDYDTIESPALRRAVRQALCQDRA